MKLPALTLRETGSAYKLFFLDLEDYFGSLVGTFKLIKSH